jgi:hypothetical protein
VWRRTCGVTCLCTSEAQRRCAAFLWSATKRSTASLLCTPPRTLGKTGSVGCPLRSRSQAAITADVSRRSGVQRCMRPPMGSSRFYEYPRRVSGDAKDLRKLKARSSRSTRPAWPKQKRGVPNPTQGGEARHRASESLEQGSGRHLPVPRVLRRLSGEMYGFSQSSPG